MTEVSPNLASYDTVERSLFGDLAISTLSSGSSKSSKADSKTPFTLPIKDFYMTDPISRASSTMAKCSSAFTKGEYNAGAEELFA